jgi:hypothetical protein
MTNEESRKEELRIMSLPGMQKKFQEAMGCQQNYDVKVDGIIFPLPIDRDNPGRGLVGMLNSQGWRELDDRFNMNVGYFQTLRKISDTNFTLALIHALASQWGIEG